ncbi:MAG: type IV pilus secretin PilQ [Nitrospirota bacterium]
MRRKNRCQPIISAIIISVCIVLPLKGPPVYAEETQKTDTNKLDEVIEKVIAAEEREGQQPQKFTGQRISLDFQDADIVNVLRLISEVSGLNIVISPDVKGKVSIKMSSVPWDQALDTILKTYGLGQIREENIIRIAPLTAIAKEREAELKAEALITRVIPVNYVDARELSDTIGKAKILSERGSVGVVLPAKDARATGVVVKDIAEKVEEVESLVKKVDKPAPQVLIEARIVEMTSTFERQLGIQWGTEVVGKDLGKGHTVRGGILTPTRTDTATYGGSLISKPTTPSTTDPSSYPTNYAVNLPVTGTPSGALSLTLGRLAGTWQLDVQLSAMESMGEGKIISTPKVITLDNQKATIRQGKRVAYETTSAEGTKVEFVDADLSLSVTPSIAPEGFISIKIETKKNEPDFTKTLGSGAPATIDTKEASTQILIRDGDTIVIGGILKKTKSDTTTGVPLLHKIPLLGWLFKRELTSDSTTELLIFITPRVIKTT